jgi:hypothetical protein
MVVHRLKQYLIATKGAFSSKYYLNEYSVTNPLSQIFLNAGLYKPSTFSIQHSLILSNLGGKPTTLSYQSHGKKKRQTLSTNTCSINNHVLPVVDKLAHEFLPIVSDFKTPK